jgi:Sulfotransferase domain
MSSFKAAFKDAVTPIYRPAYNRLRSLIMIDRDADCKKTLFISTGGRTGGTWVSQLVNFDGAYRLMFEPISRERLLVTPELAPSLPDNRLQYIRPDSTDGELIRRVEAVITGRYRQPLTDQYNYTPRIVFKKRLVKETKSNLWAKWMHERFPRMPIMLLLRHPVPAVMSRYFKYFDLPVDQRASVDDPARRQSEYEALTLGQPKLLADHLGPLRSVIESARSVFAQRMVVWCIQNYVPLHQFAPGEVHLAFYENFCLDPIGEMRKLRMFLGEDLRVAEVARIERRSTQPSSTFHRTAVHQFQEQAAIRGFEQIAKWMKRIQPDERQETQDLLRAFGLDSIYSADDPRPNPEGATALMRANAPVMRSPGPTSVGPFS